MNSSSVNVRPHGVAPERLPEMTEAEAFAYCAELTHSHYENFPVGSALVPKALQPAIHSLYAFMRTADDFSDENRRAGDEKERLERLTNWESMLDDCEKGVAKHPIFIALRATLRHHQLPVQWLRDLLQAFKMDVTVREYPTEADLLAYCRYSANPVGRLILTLFGYRDEKLYPLSDSICTALQLANHWQDVAVDLEKDRIYLPQEDLKRYGLTSQDLFELKKRSSPAAVSGGSLRRNDGPPTEALGGDKMKNFRRLMAFEVDRAQALFTQGKALPERVSGRLRLELRLTWRGGARTLEKIRAAHYNVFEHRPVVTKFDWFIIALRSLI